ncbi:MAG: hypothetical protein HYY06_13410 [Deltaproteobacteria bacterium]|nr:hypothetical protein [Deltaproteobacteria bacterium]
MSAAPANIGGLLGLGGYLTLYGAFLFPSVAPGLALIGAGALLLGFGTLKFRVPSKGRRRFDAARSAAAERARGMAQGPAASTGGELVRCRGRAKVLQPVAGPTEAGTKVAAWQTADARACGRFAIIDGTIVGVVDDDCFEVWQEGAEAPGGVIDDGSEVEAVGHATRVVADDIASLGQSGYRGEGLVVLFDGSQLDPVRLFLPG